jgi:hypothetical protein
MFVMIYTLDDGIKIEVSDRKSNRSGYTGAALSPAWTLNSDKPFIAACGNPTDSAIMAHMRAQDRTSWHGGSYSDAREAAYVVGMFRNDPIETDKFIGEHGRVTDFPPDLYSLPVFMSFDDAKILLNENRVKTEGKRIKKSNFPKTQKLKLEEVMAVVGRSIKNIKSPKKNPSFIRELVINNFPTFATAEDAVILVKNTLI